MRIVESVAPMRTVAATVDSLPLVDIGGIGDPHAEFPGPVHSAFRLSDGRIVLAAWATAALRVYDSTGRWLRDIGRQGSGPGEFEGLGWVHRGPNDTLVTYELMNRRVSVFDAEGHFDRLVHLQPMPNAQFPRLQGVTSSGLLATALAFQGAFPEFAVIRLRRSVYRFSGDGQLLDSLLELPVLERISVGGGGTWPRPFDLSTSVAALEDGLAVGHTGRYEIAFYDSDGTLRQVARRSLTPDKVSRAEYQAAVDTLVDQTMSSASGRARFREVLESSPANTVRPAFAALLPAPDGGVWVLGYDGPSSPSRQVSVFGADGRWQGDLTLPAGLYPLQAGRDFVLGTWQDADEVTHVRVYRLRSTTS